jgi:hypothetical protein
MKSLLKYGLAIVFFFTTLLSGQAAFAAPPADIVATWTGRAVNTEVDNRYKSHSSRTTTRKSRPSQQVPLYLWRYECGD